MQATLLKDILNKISDLAPIYKKEKWSLDNSLMVLLNRNFPAILREVIEKQTVLDDFTIRSYSGS